MVRRYITFSHSCFSCPVWRHWRGPLKKNQTEAKTKGRRCWLGDEIVFNECCTRDLVPRWFEENDYWRKHSWRNGWFGKMYEWFCVMGNRMIILFSKLSIPPNIFFIHPFLQNLPGAKWLVRHSIPSSKQQLRPLPYLLFDLFLCARPSFKLG